MSKIPFIPVDVRLDEVNLSLLGYDISDAQARLVAEYDKWDKEYQYEIHWSIRGRFQADEWVDRHDSRPPRIVPFVSVPDLSPAKMTHYLDRLDHGEKVVKISHRHTLGVVKKPLEATGIAVELSAFDVSNVAYELTPIGRKTRKIPLDLYAEPAACGCAPRVAEVHCSIVTEKRSNDQFLQVSLSGAFDLCSMEKEREEYGKNRRSRSGGYRQYESHPLPTLGIELMDDTGFLLEEDDEAIEMEAEIDRADGPPMRQPRWIFSERWDLDQFSAPPARVVARFRGGGDN